MCVCMYVQFLTFQYGTKSIRFFYSSSSTSSWSSVLCVFLSVQTHWILRCYILWLKAMVYNSARLCCYCFFLNDTYIFSDFIRIAFEHPLPNSLFFVWRFFTIHLITWFVCLIELDLSFFSPSHSFVNIFYFCLLVHFFSNSIQAIARISINLSIDFPLRIANNKYSTIYKVLHCVWLGWNV